MAKEKPKKEKEEKKKGKGILRCTPELRHEVKRKSHRVENGSCHRSIVASQSTAVGEAETGSAGEQPARNSRSETHRDDERGATTQAAAPSIQAFHRIDRFPNA